MKVNIFALLIFKFMGIGAYAQDILYKTDGTKDSVKIEEVTPDEVVYKKYNRVQSPTYRIYKSSIVLIEYEDGTIEVYNGQLNSSTGTSKKIDEGFTASLGKNIISLNYLNILNGNLHLGYERILKPDILGLKLSVNLGIDDVGSDILAYRRKYTTGLDLNIYPGGQGKIKYFLGPAFRVGVVEDYYYYGPTPPGTVDRSYLSFLFNNGFYIQPTKSLYLGIQGALGIARFGPVKNSGSYAELDGIIAFNLGWRF